MSPDRKADAGAQPPHPTHPAVRAFVWVVGLGCFALGLMRWLSGATPSTSARWAALETLLYSHLGSFGLGLYWFVLGAVVLVLAHRRLS